MSKLLKCLVRECCFPAYGDSLYCIDHQHRPLWERIFDRIIDFLIGD